MEMTCINTNNKITTDKQFEDTSIYSINKANVYCDMTTKLKELIENIQSCFDKKETTLDEEINAKFLELDFGAEFNIDAAKIGADDAIFFINILNQQNLLNYTVQDDKLSLQSSDGKKINATNALINMINTSYTTNKPIRLDFDKDVTVILKLDREGKIQAHFIPGSSEVERYIKNNISSLKQVFEEENINYSSLSYSQDRSEGKNKKNRKRK